MSENKIPKNFMVLDGDFKLCINVNHIITITQFPDDKDKITIRLSNGEQYKITDDLNKALNTIADVQENQMFIETLEDKKNAQKTDSAE